MQRGLRDRKAVCPSVCLSVKCVNCDKRNESSVHILTPYERSIHLVFRHEEWLVGNVPFYLKFWAKLTPFPASKNGYFQWIFTRSASALTPSEKSSVITNRMSTTGFPMSLDEHRTLPLTPQRGPQRRQFFSFPYRKLDFPRRKSATCLLYTSPSPRDGLLSRMPSSA